MNKKIIGIDHKPGSFSDRWIFFLKKYGVDYEIINPIDTNFFKNIEYYAGVMFHIDHHDYLDFFYKKDLIYQIDHYSSCEVFPKYKDLFFFNNKILQKNFFEKNGIPTPETFISFSKTESLNWLNKAKFPKVFKLKCGASGNNISLVNNFKEAKKKIDRAFSRGFDNLNYRAVIKDINLNKERNFFEKIILNFLYYMYHFGILKSKVNTFFPKERNYVIFQNYINSKYDLRIIKMGKKIIGVKRLVRKDDFRASGSNIKVYNIKEINFEVIKIANKISKILDTECMAYDFVIEDDKFYILEMSNGFVTGNFYEDCEGYFDEELKWNEEKIYPEKIILETFLKRTNIELFDEKF